MLRKKTKTTYRFPHTKDTDGYPKISSVIKEKENRSYEQKVEFLYQKLQPKCANSSPKESLILTIDEKRFQPVCMTSEKCMALAYPTRNLRDSTVSSSGEVLVMTNMVIDYFCKDYSANLLEDLLRIALWGYWHRRRKTYLHYIDVMCEAYRIETTRLSNINHISGWMKRGGVSVALLDDEIFPEFFGDCLVFITELNTVENYIKYYFVGDDEETRRTMKIEEFILHTKVLWGMEVK